MRFVLPFLLFPVLAVLIVLAWWAPNRPAPGGPDMPAARFRSLSFAPYRAGESPLTGRFPSQAEAASDLALIAPDVDGIRVYAANEGEDDIAALARRQGKKLWQGIWLGSDRARNAREIARGIAIARQYPDVVDRVVVGNEVLLRRDLPVAELIQDLDQVRRAVPQKVTYADVWDFWLQFPQVARHVDIVTVHLLPYWEDQPTGIDRAVAHVDRVWRRMRALFPGQPVAIGETGWPSRGRERGDAVPSVVNEARFVRGFMQVAAREGFDYNLIEAFDQIWKYKNEGVVGANWGLWDAARQRKFPLSGFVVENPAWRMDAAFSLLCCVLLFGFGLACRTPGQDSFADPAGTSLAMLRAALFGLALGYARASVAPDLYDIPLRLAAVVNLSGQAVLAMLIMGSLAARDDVGRRSGAAATETAWQLLSLRRPRLGPAEWLDDLGFVFAWTAALLQLLLVFDPRYRDFPLPQFAVPVLWAAMRLGHPARHGAGWQEAVVGGVLVIGAGVSMGLEGWSNHQALVWNLACLILAAPLLRPVLAHPALAHPILARPILARSILARRRAV